MGGGGGGAGMTAGGAGAMFASGGVFAPAMDPAFDWVAAREARMANVTNVTVNTVTAPENLGETIVDALRYYERSNGPLDITIAV